MVVAGAGTGERFDRDEFIGRVAQRAGMDGPRATYAVRVVLEVVDEATQGGVTAQVREALPADLAELAQAGGRGELSG